MARKSLLATYQPFSIGSHIIMATVNDDHLCCSPIKVQVADVDVFDPANCHESLTLSNYNTSPAVRYYSHWHEEEVRSVLGSRVYSQGQHHICIRINGSLVHNALIGVTDALDPLPLSSRTPRSRSPFYHPIVPSGSHYFSGKEECHINLGQPWQYGDVIDLWLNCKQRSPIGQHQCSGKIHAINGIAKGNLWLFVSCSHPNEDNECSFHIQ